MESLLHKKFWYFQVIVHPKEMLIDQSSPKLKVNFPAKVSTLMSKDVPFKKKRLLLQRHDVLMKRFNNEKQFVKQQALVVQWASSGFDATFQMWPQCQNNACLFLACISFCRKFHFSVSKNLKRIFGNFLLSISYNFVMNAVVQQPL